MKLKCPFLKVTSDLSFFCEEIWSLLPCQQCQHPPIQLPLVMFRGYCLSYCTNLKLNRLLAHKVFQEGKRQLSQERFASAIWQLDKAKPHQANMVMNYLERVFKERMLVLKAKKVHCWELSSPALNPCDFFLCENF